MLGGELLCHRFGDDIDVVGHLPVGAYHHFFSGLEGRGGGGRKEEEEERKKREV